MAKGRVHTINLAVYPQVLTVAPGDTVRVVTEFDYVGPAISCRMISAIWHPTLFDPHNEIVRGNRSFSIPSSPLPGHHITVTIDLLVPSGEVGTDYGLYSSIRDVPGPDIYATPKWLENIITIEEVAPPPVEYTLEVTIEPPGAGHVLISSKAPYSAGEVVTLVATPYSGYEFDHWGGWPPYPGVGSTSATLNLTMDSNWWVVAVFREVAPPPAEYTLEVTIEPPGAGYVTISPSKAKYSAGEVVTLTAHPHSGYEFDHWGGWPPYPGIQSTSPSIQITMTANWWVVAAFREVAPVVTTVTVSLKNAPSVGEWQMAVYDWNETEHISKFHLSFNESAIYDIPSGWVFPLRVDILIYNPVTYQVYYRMHSTSDSFPQYHKDIFIEDFGEYYFNLATEKFEKV